MHSDQVEDVALIGRVAAGDAEAFAALFRRRHGQVYRFALHMTGSPSIAEDVTQEVFLAVMSDAARYDAGRAGRASVVAWLCGIARNHVRRRAERDRRLQPLDDGHGGNEDEGVGAVLTVEADALGDLTRAESIQALRDAVSSLPVRYREAVVVCDLEEMSYRDAAAALGCAVGTVRSRLHRGRALLAVKLVAAAGLEPNELGSARENRPGASTSSGTMGRPPNQTLQSVRNLA
jgi:RNA polymerase sigma-70 factor (ECF subfamily)